jgi:hypothetical protein
MGTEARSGTGLPDDRQWTGARGLKRPSGLSRVAGCMSAQQLCGEDLDAGLVVCPPVAVTVAEEPEDWLADAGAGRDMTHLTVHARSGRSASMQPVYVVDGARGKLSVRALDECWRPRTERLEVALNNKGP